MSETPAPPNPRPVRVAIVGGGCAGLAAAWQLSKLPGYEIHVYEQSWRLGGKGASGRDGHGQVREHGLHVWLGFYENAFRMMRECYAEVERNGWGPQSSVPGGKLAHRSIDEAFFPEPNIGVAITRNRPMAMPDRVAWTGFLPPAPGLPGEPLDTKSNPFTLLNYVSRCISLIKTLMVSVVGGPGASTPADPDPDNRAALDEAVDLDFSFDATRSPRYIVDWMSGLMRGTALTTAAGMLQAVTIVETILHRFDFSPQVSDSLLQLMEAIAAQMRKQLRDFVEIDPDLRWKTEIIDIVMTIAVGLYRDRVLFDERGLDAINHIDYRDWLQQNGATYSSVNSPFLKGIYDLTFAYRHGDPRTPQLAAGVALRGALRMFFTYRGSMFWRMRSGMGDAVFGPLYKVLAKRNVVFHLRHRLDHVELAATESGDRHISALHFKTIGDPETLDRLSADALDAFGCWDHESRRFDREAGTGQGGFERRSASHFDAVILATGVDDLKVIVKRCGLLELPRWDKLGELKTIPTCGGQAWLAPDLGQLGWQRGSGLLTGLDPFAGSGETTKAHLTTWADMTHTLATERAWRAAVRPEGDPPASDKSGSIAYFCGVMMEDAITQAALHGETEQVRRAAVAVLEKRVKLETDAMLVTGMSAQWPRHGQSHAQPLEMHVSANATAADRYALSLPGSIAYRISPLDMTVRNMAVAGDWTACGLDAGCVEGAVMSGMLAAHAITGSEPRLESIIGYDHP